LPAQTPYNRFPAPELLHVLMLPEFERAHGIGEFWGNPITRTFAELLIDCEKDNPFGRRSSASRGKATGTPTARFRLPPGARRFSDI